MSAHTCVAKPCTFHRTHAHVSTRVLGQKPCVPRVALQSSRAVIGGGYQATADACLEVATPSSLRNALDVTCARKQRKNAQRSPPKKKQQTGLGAGWEKAFNISELKEKPTKPFISSKVDGAFMLFRLGEEVFASEANSTAFKFPLSDAVVREGTAGPVAEVPFDGTTYDLKTGNVLEWCPKNNPLRFVLGSLKGKEKPIPLKVYSTKLMEDGTIYIKTSGTGLKPVV